MKRSVLAAAVLVLALAAPARATSTLDRDHVAASTDVDFIVDAPVAALKAYNKKLIVEVPDGFRVLRCGQVEHFTCTQSFVGDPHRTWLTRDRAADEPPVSIGTDHFPFRAHTTDKSGKYVFVLHQFYSDGTVADSGATVEVTGAATRAATTTTTKRTVVQPAAVSAPARVAKSVTVTTEPAWFGDNGGELADSELGAKDGGAVQSRAGLMVLLGVLASGASAAVFWLRRNAAPSDADVP